jgi:hypothetical protein
MRKTTELWICYSTISYYLFQSRVKQSNNSIEGIALFAIGSPLYSCRCTYDQLTRTQVIDTHLSLKDILKLVLRSFLKGKILVVRIPHLNAPVFSKTISRLYKLKLIRIELYDDGFLGILENPPVCRYLKPIFRSICCWDITEWKLSSETMSKILNPRAKQIKIYPVTCNSLLENSIDNNQPVIHTTSSIFIIESKYMDYQMLSKIFTDTDLQQLTCEPPYYYEHPWSIKRNKYWPLDVDRKVVEHISLEKHLTMNVGINSLIYTGMTSSVILLCELVKQGRLSIGNLTLLLQEPAVLSKYQDPNELDSFINFIVRVYSESVKLTVWYNGKNIRA